MKYLFLVFHSTIFFASLLAEEVDPSDSYTLYFELGEISAPLSFYTDSWDPKETLPLKFHGIRVEEKNLVVNLNEAIKKSREEQDLLRSQNSWLFEPNPWIFQIKTKEDCYEEIGIDDMRNEEISDKYEVE
jgi:hypothetical protein